MLLTLLVYAYLRGVLSSRAIQDRCRYDVTLAAIRISRWP
ncbi:MAG: hypothetical protein ABSA53_22860 [Streptosporangiaceae bacterium]|jgi:transposase